MDVIFLQCILDICELESEYREKVLILFLS
jgi:hypothetical protein